MPLVSTLSTHVPEMYEASVAICKTKTAVYMHGVTSGFVTVPMAYVASLKSGTTFGSYWPEFHRTTRLSYIRV